MWPFVPSMKKSLAHEVRLLQQYVKELEQEVTIISGDGPLAMSHFPVHENLKKLRTDIEKLSFESRRLSSDMCKMWSTFHEANHRITDIQRVIVDHLGLEIIVEEPAKSDTIKLVKKGKK